ncbi:hypothetical protein GGR09_001610 [Bartonella heixiaziensis]
MKTFFSLTPFHVSLALGRGAKRMCRCLAWDG